jgi:glycosyltransferase involved in cell wall biosynthesis
MPVSRLVFGPPPGTERLFYTNLWFRGHNNPRYSELLPRLRRLDPYLITIGEGRVRRGLEYRFHRATRRVRERVVHSLAARRYRGCFTTAPEQIAYFSGPMVADIDDPWYSRREIELLKRPNLVAYVVTAPRAAEKYEALGVHKPWHVVPQGFSLRTLDREEAERVRREVRADREVVVGYMASWLLAAEDRQGRNSVYNVDHLLDLWDEIRRRVPSARLWLVGAASERVRDRCAGRDDILLLGRLPRERALAHVANFDIALYPRAEDVGIQAAKVAEYMGLGVPTVSYDYEVTEDLRESGAGVLVESARDFAEAVAQLAVDDDARARIAAAAKHAGEQRDWDLLARRYETSILDVYLPAAVSPASRAP